MYTRVYFTLLGSRYTLGKISPRRQMLLSLYDATIFVYKPSLRTRGTSPAITDCMLGDQGVMGHFVGTIPANHVS